MAHKHKKPNPNPIRQISPIEYFSQDPEQMPAWLKNHKKGGKVDFSQLLASRIVYYPGSWFDGSPIRTFNTAHAAHIYVYADYGNSKEKVDNALSNEAFKGYHLYDEQEVSREDMLPSPLCYHITEEERQFAVSGYDMSISPDEAFAFLKIYERNENYGDEHGAWRFALLYIAADANATYDALFGNTNITPYACVVCANMGSGYTCFVRDSLLEKIAQRTNCLPQYLLCMQDYGWEGYAMLRTVSGTGTYGSRFVWTKDMGEITLDDFDEDLRRILLFTDEG